MPITRNLFVVAAFVAALFAAPANVPAYAAGSDSAPTPQRTVNPDFTADKAAVEAGQYADAVTLMTRVVGKEPRNADALNYLGYSYRKLGDFDNSLVFYKKALAVNPDHRGANEYLGELYLQMGDLAKAEERLKRLDSICFFGCDEYSELKQAIADFKAGKTASGDKW